MNVFGFGPVRQIETRRGTIGTVGSLALHIQCAWRIEEPDGRIITGNVDLYTYAGPSPEPSDWHCEQGFSLQSLKLDTLLGERLGSARAYHYASGMKVSAASFNRATGDLTITFGGGQTLRVFPNSSEGEEWRLLGPAEDAPHLVFETR